MVAFEQYHAGAERCHGSTENDQPVRLGLVDMISKPDHARQSDGNQGKIDRLRQPIHMLHQQRNAQAEGKFNKQAVSVEGRNRATGRDAEADGRQARQHHAGE
jgi:hypothetical protein